MGAKVKEHPKGSGDYYIFIHHQGKRKAMKVGKDKRKANRVASVIQEKLLTGDYNIGKNDCPKFKPYAERWLTLPHDWKKSTYDNYRDNLKLHAYPVLGKLRLNEITRKNLKTMFDDMLIKGLSSSTVILIKAPINGVLSHAFDSEIIDRNPLDKLKIKGNKNTFKVEPLNEEQVSKLLEQAQIFMDGQYYAHFLTLLRTGIRLGELIALKWKDVDFTKRQIMIKRSGRKGRITDTKNHKNRYVDMTPHLAETLQDWYTAQKRIALKNGHPFKEWVFTGKRGDNLCPISLKNALNRCCDGAKLNHIRIHDLRHSYATIRLLRGHNIGDVSYQLGHSSISMTYDLYTHWVPGRFKSEVDDLDDTQKNTTIHNQKIKE